MRYIEVKYWLVDDEVFDTGILGFDIDAQWIRLDPDGKLTVKAGYGWDGASGPTIDDNTNMRGALGHDALYDIMRQGLLPIEHRGKADELLSQWCVEDGMIGLRAEFWEKAVKMFAEDAATSEGARKIYDTNCPE